MSQENVDNVHSIYEAWNRDDVEGILVWCDPNIAFQTSGAFLDLDPVYGHHGFRSFWREFTDAWDSLLISVEELRDCGERVVALVTFEARARDGLEVRRQAGSVFTFENGLAVRVANYRDWTPALEAVGFRE